MPTPGLSFDPFLFAAHLKSGSTFLRLVLAEVSGLKWTTVGDFKLDVHVMNMAFKSNRRFYFSHAYPDPYLADYVSTMKLSVIVTERNIWDAMRSWVEHMMHEYRGTSAADWQREFVLSRLHWMCAFSLAWRRFAEKHQRCVIINYDTFAASPETVSFELCRFVFGDRLSDETFSGAFAHIDTTKTKDRAMTRATDVSQSHHSVAKFNIGIVGRGCIYAGDAEYQKIEAHLLSRYPPEIHHLIKFPVEPAANNPAANT